MDRALTFSPEKEMPMRLPSTAFATALLISVQAAAPAESQVQAAPVALAYADLADLALAAPIAAHVRVARATALRERDAAGVPPGHRRFYVEAEMVSLIRGPGGFPAQVSYLVDLPNDSLGRPARIERRSEHLLFAAGVPGRPGELRLITRDAKLAYDPAAAEQVRSLLREAARPDAPPRITGIGRAFHVPGSLPGESETQIFLQTADNRPVSLTILRRPGERPRWAVALSEIVDDAAEPPRPESLLWYRLACTLPPSLPAQSLRDSSRNEAAAIQADYRLVMERLGPCRRSRTQR
jgi:hypothetical protein